jgi:uncharacterized protein (DUF885 family)
MTSAGPVTQLADELVEVLFRREPLSPSMLGLDGAHDRLADPSAAADAEYRALFTGVAERADALLRTELDATDRVTAATIAQQARAQVAMIDTRAIEFTVTDFFVGPAGMVLTVLPMLGLGTPELAEAYLKRLAALPEFLSGALARHRQGVADGLTPVARLVESAMRHLDRYLADEANDPLRGQPAPDGVEDYDARRDALLADVVRPAFRAYRDGIGELLPQARPDEQPGLRWLPGGDARYAALAAVHTSTDRTPDDLHDTGLRLIADLAREYAEVGGRVFGTTELPAIFERMRTDPALRWDSAEEVLEAARTAIGRAEEAAPRWFGRLPANRCEVRPVPPADAEGAAAAFYMAPAMDGSRPGVYFANTDRFGERFRHVAEATAFHEAVPGHHFQISLALELDELPLLRRIADVNAFAEGWGLYSERLAEEMGLYSDDVARLGMLSADSMRAGRLVVDTGLHAKGWSRRQAVDYLLANTPMAEVEINAEVDRYTGYPGQALSYMVGRLELQRLRSVAEQALGDRFDIRAFHDLVLGGGALPMSVLEGVVEDWVLRVKEDAGQ